MPRRSSPSRHLFGNRVASAKSRTEKVQEDLELAEAELHLANQVIARRIGAADNAKDAQLAEAVIQNEKVEEKLHDAGEELQVVKDLLTSEEHERRELEEALKEFRGAEGAALAGERSGEGSASVVEHLRELTRHRLSTDAAEPARHDLAPPPPRGV